MKKEYPLTFSCCGITYPNPEYRIKRYPCQVFVLEYIISCKGWKYIGVWERSLEKKRLHFRELFNIHNGSMVGEVIEVNN